MAGEALEFTTVRYH